MVNEFGKIPPQATDIEEVLLGALLLDPSAFSRVKGLLRADMFYNNEHLKTYEAICEMHVKGKEVDILTLKTAYPEFSIKYLTGLTSRVGSAAHIQHHAAIIYEKYMAREMIRIGSQMVEDSYDGDALDLLKHYKLELENKLLGFLGMNSYGISIIEAANKSLDEYFKREKMIKEGKRSGIPSTFKSLDEKTAGWQPEHLMVLAARPAMGKTSLAISFLMTAADAGYSVAMYSLEMSAVKLTDKIICSIADVDLGEYKKGKLMDAQRTAIENATSRFDNWRVTFSDTMLNDIDQIHASAQSIKSKLGLDFIIIDYLQLLTSRDKNANREREVAENSRKAKLMAVELGVPVLLLSQLNRSLESRGDKRPMLSDLRESGAIEQDADMVLFVYRDCVYNETEGGSDGELIVSKHREGPTGVVQFNYNSSLTKFWDNDTQLPF